MAYPNCLHCITVKARNVCVSCVLMFFAGAMYAVGVFDPSITESTPELAGVWASSMATMTLVSAPAMILAALYLTGAEGGGDHQKSTKIHVLVSLGGLCFLGLSVGSFGITHTNKSLVRLGVTMQGIPFGIFYVFGIELLAAWMSQRPGLAIGIGQMAFGIGTIAFSGIFELLTKALGVATATHTSALVLTMTTFLIAPLLRWPSASDSSLLEDSSDEQAYAHAGSFKGVKISTKSLPFLREFWLYMGAVFASQVGFALLPYYFEMSADFGVPQLRAVLMFQLTNAAATVARLCAGALADRCGSRRLMVALLGMQVGLFALLAVAAQAHVFAAFASAALGVLVVFSSVSSASAVLARDLFGTMNSAIVFGVGAGVTMGLGESIAAALTGALASDAPHDAGPARFNAYFALAAIASAAGALCAWAAAPCPAALPPTSRYSYDEESSTSLVVAQEDYALHTETNSLGIYRSNLSCRFPSGLQTCEKISNPHMFSPSYGSIDSLDIRGLS